MSTKQNKATFGQALQVLTLVNQRGANSKKLNELFEKGLLSDLFESDPTRVDRDIFRETLGLLPIAIELRVNYDLRPDDKLDALIKTGRFGTNQDSHEKMLRVKFHDLVVAELVIFEKPAVHTRDVRKMLRRRKLRSATCDEMLTFAELYGHKTDSVVVALGAFLTTGRDHVLTMFGETDPGKEVLLSWQDKFPDEEAYPGQLESGVWGEMVSFLAIRQ